MGVFITTIDLILCAGAIVVGAIGVVLLALFGIVVRVLPFLIKLSAVSVIVYAFLRIFGII